MKRVLILAAFLAACAPVGFAQVAAGDRDKVNVFVGFSHNRVDTGEDDPSFGGVVDEREGFNGVNASITGNLSRYVGLKFDYSYHRKEFSETFNVICVTAPCPSPVTISADVKVQNFLGGIQFKDNVRGTDNRFRPFGHILIGAHNTSAELQPVSCLGIGVCPPAGTRDDETGFAAAVGGGLDVRLNDRISVRAIQLDWNPNRFGSDSTGGSSGTSHNFRVGVGIVFH